MAKLIPTRKEWAQEPRESFMDYMGRLSRILNSLGGVEQGQPFTGRTISFPVADGSAIYVINNVRPLEIELFPYADAYTIPAAHVRGLELSDIEQQAAMNSFWKKRTTPQKKA